MATTNRPTHAAYAPSSAIPLDAPMDLPYDDVFHLLQTFRRRETIRYMLHEDGPVKMRDVAEHVAAREHDTTVADLTSTQRQRVYIPLYQSHLPKLDEAGVIEYDKPRGIVRPTDGLQQLRPYLEAATASPSGADPDQSDGEVHSDHRYHVAALVASIGVLFASAFGALQLSGVVVGGIITTAFVLATMLDRR